MFIKPIMTARANRLYVIGRQAISQTVKIVVAEGAERISRTELTKAAASPRCTVTATKPQSAPVRADRTGPEADDRTKPFSAA
jgi:hypothetical protein